MSCFIVSDYHVSALVARAIRQGADAGLNLDYPDHELAAIRAALAATRCAA